MRKQTNTDTYKCPHCLKELSISPSHFYMSKSPIMQIKDTERSIFCKECTMKIHKMFLDKYQVEDKAIYETCRFFDIYFGYAVLKMANSQSEKATAKNSELKSNTFSYYMQKVFTVGAANGGGATFKDSERLMSDITEELEINNPYAFKITQEMIDFWGHGFTPNEYEYLEKEKPHWFDRYKCDTRGEEVLYKQICYQLLDIKRAREKGGDVSKLLDVLQKLMESANVKPKDANALSDSDTVDAFGTRIRDMELYEPAEYFEDRNLYRDFSGFEKYFKDWVVRPLKNLLKGTRDFEVGDDE